MSLNHLRSVSRRDALRMCGGGFGALALAGMCGEQARAAKSPLAAKQPHFAAKAKRVIFLFMDGGPSHVDTFDYKPGLEKADGKKLPYEQPKNGSTGHDDSVLMKSQWKFRQHGESGLWISDVFPHLAKHADKLCLINSMHHETSSHPQGVMMMHTGEFRFARPSAGSWVTYGLGSESDNLPAYVVLNPRDRNETFGAYSSSFLPAVYNATIMRNIGDGKGEVVRYLSNPRRGAGLQRKQLDLVQAMNQDLLAERKQDEHVDALIESYERAFRMQSALPQLLDLSTESKATLELYGLDKKARGFGAQCLVARRLAEQGVRFIELHQGGWDSHNDLSRNLAKAAENVDQPIAGLLADLDQRGMLEETLVFWGGEFGRTPAVEDMKDKSYGRDHNGAGFTYWMAGGGIRGGLRYGATDEIGWLASENKVRVRDLHATILHQLGLDCDRLTYRFGGRDYTLTDVDGQVIRDLLA